MKFVAVTAVVACAAAGVAAAADEPVVRACNSSVYGGLGRWQTRSVLVGPLGFVAARSYASSTASFETVGGGRYRGTKLLAVVRTGWVVRVVVPAAQRDVVALQYDLQDFNKAVVPSDSEHDVTFTACPPGRPFLGPKRQGWTQFNGAIVVAGRRCVTLHVYFAKQGHPLPQRPQRAVLSFGAGACRG